MVPWVGARLAMIGLALLPLRLDLLLFRQVGLERFLARALFLLHGLGE